MTTDTALALLRDAAGNLYMAYNAFTRNDAIAWEPLKETADRITALLDSGGWMPIETAPKDGTRIMVASDVYGSVWCGVSWRKMIRVPDRWESFIGPVPFHPTHWMPRPAPPAAISREPLP